MPVDINLRKAFEPKQEKYWEYGNAAIISLGLERHPIEGKLIQDNETYSIIDYNIEGVTVSVTTLHNGRATRGHSHPHAEAYFFKTPAQLRLGHTTWEVKAGQLVLVKPKQFHRVYAVHGEAVFVCIFEGARDESRVDFKPPPTP